MTTTESNAVPACSIMLDALSHRLMLASRDELRVIDRVLQRLELGRKRYGAIDVSKPIDWRRERFEERLDALVYDIAEELALEDAAVARRHAAAAAQIEALAVVDQAEPDALEPSWDVR